MIKCTEQMQSLYAKSANRIDKSKAADSGCLHVSVEVKWRNVTKLCFFSSYITAAK